MSNQLLKEELEFRASKGQFPVKLESMKVFLKSIGYRLDRSADCRSISRWMSGPRAGKSYPACTTGVVEIDTRLSFAHVNARRDANFRSLQEARFSGDLFAVVGNYVLEI